MKFTRIRWAVAALAIVAALSGAPALAQAQDYRLGPLTVVQPWSRATAPSQPAGAVFLRIENSGAQPDRLIAVESNLAEATSLHAMIRDGDVVKMRPVEGGIEIPPQGHVELAPGGRHVMLIGLHGRLVQDSTVALTLVFERAGRLQIEAVVEGAGARGPSAGGGHDQHGAPRR